jgi:D-alanyl-D-alanine carboxypeptidase
MGMRVGLIRLLATVMLMCTPAIVMAAPAKNTSKAASAKAGKAKVAKASKSVAKSKYNAPIFTAIVVDAATGQVLSEVNADTRSYPASLTKMMTLYLLFEALEKGEVHLDTAIPVSARAAAAAPSKLNLQPKQTISVEQAIKALITKSANDVAVAVGERLGGTEADFAVKMTAKARALGMNQTTFKNAHGLPNPEQFSTARDMATLGNRLLKDFPQYYGEFSRMEFDYKGQTIRTHNRLLEFYEGADGIKTGFTAASGFNLVASASRNGYRVIGVMFGGASARSRDQRLAAMMDQGFAVLSGQPDILIAKATTPNTDRIATQIALASQGESQTATEEGDTDEPFQPAAKTSSIETINLPPLPQASETPAPQRLAALEPAPTPLPSVTSQDDATAWGIQIGAYAKRAAAETQATTAAAKLKGDYADAKALVIPVAIKGKTMYRARVVGLPNKDLMRVCSMLGKQAKAGCQAVPPESIAAR